MKEPVPAIFGPAKGGKRFDRVSVVHARLVLPCLTPATLSCSKAPMSSGPYDSHLPGGHALTALTRDQPSRVSCFVRTV
jgi:hypothetical protein